MSLDCYPLGARKTIALKEQPLALESAYNEDLFISVVDQCQSIAVFDLSKQKLISSFRIGYEVLVDELAYCPAGDYIACIGHKNGLLSIFTAFDWRSTISDNNATTLNRLRVSELSVNVIERETQDFRAKITHLDCCRRSGNLAVCCGDVILIYRYIEDGKYQVSHINATRQNCSYFCHMISVKLSLWATQVRLTENYLAVSSVDHVQVIKLELLTLQIGQANDYVSNTSAWSLNGNRKQITWNLNTRKLVRLPTLMQNTSSNLSSYHVCHPLELLGPASESIACRVSAPIYLSDYCQNQLEAVVMLCKQFEKGFVKSVSIQPVYLSQLSELGRLNISSKHMQVTADDNFFEQADTNQRKLLKSEDYNLLVSVTCVVTTLTNCFVYSLHGKKVVRSQTISHPHICVDSRHDLLNMYILTSLGLQVCSTGDCDSVFRYDWSSSADLQLSCVPMHRSRVISTKNYLILVPSSINGSCEIEIFEKPDLHVLNKRILHVVDRCDSISVRANLLTYLHASAQLQLLEAVPSMSADVGCVLQGTTLMLCKQLLQKKQTNPITNSKIDRAIKHLLDTSKCDLEELIDKLQAKSGDYSDHEDKEMLLGELIDESSGGSDSDSASGCVERGHETRRRQTSRRTSRNASNEELIRIYSKMLDDLSVHSTDDNSSFSASFMRRQASGTSFGHIYASAGGSCRQPQTSAASPASVSHQNVYSAGDDDDNANCHTNCALNLSGACDEQNSDCESVVDMASESAADIELFEAICGLDTCEWLDMLAKCKDASPDEWTTSKTRPYVEAKLRLVEAQFIFDRLRQNSFN